MEMDSEKITPADSFNDCSLISMRVMFKNTSNGEYITPQAQRWCPEIVPVLTEIKQRGHAKAWRAYWGDGLNLISTL